MHRSTSLRSLRRSLPMTARVYRGKSPEQRTMSDERCDSHDDHHLSALQARCLPGCFIAVLSEVLCNMPHFFIVCLDSTQCPCGRPCGLCHFGSPIPGSWNRPQILRDHDINNAASRQRTHANGHSGGSWAPQLTRDNYEKYQTFQQTDSGPTPKWACAKPFTLLPIYKLQPAFVQFDTTSVNSVSNSKHQIPRH